MGVTGGTAVPTVFGTVTMARTQAGKPYDTTTGLYNYGYRDYQPEVARFTTIDPIRDGANWFAYVNNDPVNWVDLWGLTASEPSPAYFTQSDWIEAISGSFAGESCAATSLLNEISEEYTTQTGTAMNWSQGLYAMLSATTSNDINQTDATVNSWSGAANTMWGSTGLPGTWTYNADGNHQIYAIDRNNDNTYAEHFVNSNGDGTYRDPWSGNTGQVDNLTLQSGRETRGLDFNP
jgi:RHS repeat-associated protein